MGQPPSLEPNGKEPSGAGAAPVVIPVLDLFLKVLAGTSLAVAATAAVLGPRRTLVAASANAALDLVLLWRLRKGRPEGAAFLSALGLLLVSLHAIARGSGIHDIGMVVVAMVMMLSATMSRPWQALVIAGGAAVGVWLVGAAKVTGRFEFDRDVRPGWDDVVVVTVLLVAAALLMRVVVNRLRNGLVELERSRERRLRLEEELRHAERLRALGQLASAVAHDFNNELTGIVGGADLLRRSLPAGDPRLHHVEEISAAAFRSADLTRQLLATARRAEPRQEPLDLAALVQRVTTLLRRTLPGNIQIEAGEERGSFSTLGDSSLLHAALLNLGVNARDAMPAGGVIRFRLEQRTLGAEEAQALELTAGRYLELTVSDTGSGMDSATLARIFDPFFTTKDRGTGLGLAAAFGTLRAHGGSISATSAPGQGSCFRLLLPHIEPPPATLPIPAAAFTGLPAPPTLVEP